MIWKDILFVLFQMQRYSMMAVYNVQAVQK